MLLRQKHFGFAQDGDSMYPFVLEPPKSSEQPGIIRWSNDETGTAAAETNLFKRRIVVGEFYTRFEPEEGDWPYRAIWLIPLPPTS